MKPIEQRAAEDKEVRKKLMGMSAAIPSVVKSNPIFRKDRSLKNIFPECAPGRREIAVKVVDIFGNDAMAIVEVTL